MRIELWLLIITGAVLFHIYTDGKYTKTMSLDELTKIALSYRKKLQPKMKRQNIIGIFFILLYIFPA